MKTHCVLDTPFPPSVFKKFVSLRIRLLRISCARTSYNLLSSFAEITTRRTLQGIYEHIVLAEKRHNLVMFCESDCVWRLREVLKQDVFWESDIFTIATISKQN
ncbi:hypothetical protein Avbf_05721 [Armadillidium vulgare]|nr:hypothetical protein Avbf_05721 [Armadillidium vulgare]